MQLSEHEAAVAGVAGLDLVRRAIGYARGGAVTQIAFDHTGDVITAKVQGTGARPYATRVILTRGRGGSIDDYLGVCSCPVGDDCKHAVALMLAAIPPSELAGRRRASVPNWRDALDTLRVVARDREPHVDEPPPVALQFATTDYGVTIRPVMRGRKDNWVRSGISWNTLDSLRYSQSPQARASHRVLSDLCSLASDTSGYMYSRPTELPLAEIDSARLWDVLGDAVRIGVPFVAASASDDPVIVHASAVTASLDVSADDTGAVVAPRLLCNGAELGDAEFLLIGTPPHGVVWLGNDPGLQLAPLAPTDMDLGLLFDLGRVHVPSAEVPEFLDEYAPSLQVALPVVSSDGSVDVPELGPPELVLQLTYRDGRLELSWTWRSASGSAELIESLAAHGHGRGRGAQRSRELVDAATAACSALAQLLDGERLAPHAVLSGPAMIVFASSVRPALDILDGVRVEQVGPPFTIREANQAPTVALTAGDDDSPPLHRDWLDLTVTIDVDGEQVAFSDVFRAVAAGEPVMILPSGTWFSLDRPDFRELADLIAESRLLHDAEPGTIRLTPYQAGAIDTVARNADTSELPMRAMQWQRSLRALAQPDDTDDPPPLPASFRAELRKYQRSGFDWLVRLYEHGLGGVLADEMGLGKTVQCLALFCHARERAPGAPPFLVVAPTSVVSNWATEAARFAPELRVAVVTASARRRAALAGIATDVDVVVTSYALFRIDHVEYAEQAWTGLILDEAQFVKNHRAQVHKCAAKLRAPFTLAITGTPMENNLTELWAMFSLAAPGLFPNLKAFEKYYRTPIEKGGDSALLQQLRRRIRPFMLRRTKAEVVTDLPAKQEQVLELDLDTSHHRAYQTLLARERRKVMGLLGDLDRNQFEILRSLTILRQASLDISLVDEHHAAVPSTKLDEVVRMLDEIRTAGHRTIVFSQFTRFLGRVRSRLDDAGIGYAYLDGRTKDRGAVVDAFKRGVAPVFLISLKAGGFGLNLTEADYCILLDPWWNGAAEAQAVDRVHRIGQTKPVTVYRLVARDTIEQKVMAIKEGKAALVASIMNGDEWSGTKLSADEIRELIA